MTTKLADLYDPEVWEDLAQAQFLGNVVVANAAASSDTLVGQPGSTVTFPRWLGLSEMPDLAEGVPMDVEKLTQSSSEATIKEAGKAVGITDTADLSGLGNAQDEAIRQFGVLAARKVDSDLITVASATVAGGVTYADGRAATDSNPFRFTTTAGAGFTWDGLVDGIEKFGDDFEPSEFEGLYIRAEQRSQIWKDEQFIRASELGTGGAGTVVRRGFIGEVAGLPVYVTNRLAAKKALILKRGALGVLWKRRPIVEQDRDILSRENVVTTNLHYAVKRLDDRGVLELTIAD